MDPTGVLPHPPPLHWRRTARACGPQHCRRSQTRAAAYPRNARQTRDPTGRWWQPEAVVCLDSGVAFPDWDLPRVTHLGAVTLHRPSSSSMYVPIGEHGGAAHVQHTSESATIPRHDKLLGVRHRGIMSWLLSYMRMNLGDARSSTYLALHMRGEQRECVRHVVLKHLPHHPNQIVFLLQLRLQVCCVLLQATNTQHHS